MVVQKISVNTSSANSFGASPLQQQQVAGGQAHSKPRKDYTKAIGWVAAGLATAGLAGVLIYNARKGKPSGSSDPLLGVGTFVRKFLEESIFAKSAAEAQNGATHIAFKRSTDGNDLQLCAENFGCHLVKKVPEGRTDIPNFEFTSSPLKIKIFNENTDSARFDFALGEYEDFNLSMKVDSWRGKIQNVSAKDGKDSYNFTTEQCQNIIDALDPDKLINEPSYRAMYVHSLFQTVGDVVRKTKFQKIAEKSGKTFDEIKDIFGSKEFKSVSIVKEVLDDIHGAYNLTDNPFESEVYKLLLKGKDEFEMLDDFVAGKTKLNIIDDFVETDVRFPADKVCYDLTIPTADGAGVSERLRVSKDTEYLLYERVNPENPAEKLKIRTYYPPLVETNSQITDIETKGASFFIDSTSSGLNRVEVTHPDSKEPLKFSFYSNGQWDEGLDYGDELQPYMEFIEKLSKIMSKKASGDEFILNFPTQGQKMLEELAK